MSTGPGPGSRAAIAEALTVLGVERMLLAIHDASFPSDPDEDVGAGSPGTRAAGRLFELARDLGFSGVQLGPSGETSRDNPSPYDGSVFSRAIAHVPVAVFAPDGPLHGLVAAATLDAIGGDGGERGDHRRAHDVTHALVAEAGAAFRRGARPDLAPRLRRFRREHAGWLEGDARAAAADAAAPEVDVEAAVAAYELAQLMAHVAHDQVRTTAHGLGLTLFADLQVGFSHRDARTYAGAFLPGHAMGAPPSRTNREGQPWNYPVLHPGRMQPGGAAFELVRARADKVFSEYDGVRIDHPHGLVCPWVYRTDADDPAVTVGVRAGARLYASPDLPDHPELARYARVEPAQLDRSLPRHADGWVRELTPAQVDRYAVLVDEIVATARRHGRSATDLSCEVLSTMPRPLGAVLARHGLGRWRVLQKADLDDATDVYRSENAEPADWVMLGNHDTASAFALVAGWDEARRRRWATHLTATLRLPAAAAAALADDDGLLVAAMFAELLACRAENVMVFFADLFGDTRRFNVPGLVSDDNWSLRLPWDFADRYRDRLAGRRALDLPLALVLALRARGDAPPELIARLAAAAGTALPAAATAG
jgi:hypothetical protein